jgi:excisionase family DNA binding protein
MSSNKKVTPAVFPISPAPVLSVDIKTAASIVGVSVWQIRSLILEKKLRPIKLGRKFVFRVADLERFLASEAAAA